MRKSLVAASLAVCTIFGFASQAFADSYDADAAKQKSSQSHNYLVETALFPLKVVAVGSALAGGIPVSIAKSTTTQLSNYTDAVATELNEYDGLSPLALISLPGESVRLLGSAAAGIIDGSVKAMDGWSKPFSAESFSLE